MKKIRNLMVALSCSSVLVAAILNATSCEVDQKVKKYFDENRVFDIEKVDEMLDYWGGDERYVDINYIPGTYMSNEIYNHFKNKKGQPITVQYSPIVPEEDKQQFNYCFNYLNDIFKVINPDYSFIVEDYTGNADIYVGYTALTNKEIIACTKPIYDKTHSSQIKSADILFNTELNMEISNSYKRLAMMHEMMHVMLGSEDVNEYQSQTFSLYNYMDVAFFSKMIDKQNENIKNSYVSLLPTDLSTFISLYGNAKTVEEKSTYVDLLNATLNSCASVCGEYQPYYEEDFSLPTKEQLKEQQSESEQNQTSQKIYVYKEEELVF